MMMGPQNKECDMNKKSAIDQSKLAAIQLYKTIKNLQEKHQPLSEDILKQLKILPRFKEMTFAEIQAQLTMKPITLANCRLVIALKDGHTSWDKLLDAYATTADTLSDEELLHAVDVTDGLLNVWFATYEEAKQYQNTKQNSFLFPYRNTYFVCMAHHIISLGVDPKDSDWERIGRDWVKSKDIEAKSRLLTQLKKARVTLVK